MGREIKKLCILIVALLVLEALIFLLWKQLPYAAFNIQNEESTASLQTEELVYIIPEITESTKSAEVETFPPETLPPETEPPRQTIDAVPQYDMNNYPDEPYGNSTVAQEGSNMTALAMVASFMTDYPFYPDEMADWLAHFLGGHYQRLEYGSDLLQLNWKRAENIHKSLEAVREGKVAIFLMTDNSLFTWKDHFIVVTGVNENGKYSVMDPDVSHYNSESLKRYFEEGFSDKDLMRGYSCGWVYDKASMPDEPFIYQPEPPAPESRYPGLELTQEDKHLLAKLICMEAASEPFEGQQAVAEVVLNRLASGRFQGSIYNIIHAEGQFPSVPYLYKAEPDYSQYKAIEQAQYGPYVLPKEVVFYAKFIMNDNYWGKIGSHHFCYPY